MFVQYSFVQRRRASAIAQQRPFEPSPALVMATGIAFMAVTSVLYALQN